ncbi:MAG: ubiquinone/menaquinone biosynthesis methyltransferase [Candidatus Adiutrix sp.]|jgi:demethylmenaquinone methyltransferase/2-methoxy-6-polyprenyl-1,4-benzoquinol methylase|nr:ubiquinone/menaquinone biosynthesis methyltransferase [Candidatus Adiutrix sp.]
MATTTMQNKSTAGDPLKNPVKIRNMFSGLARRYDLANRVMSLGMDLFWREALARRIKVLEEPGRLLDMASGTGDQIVAAKKLRPRLKTVGLDFSAAMLELARPKFAPLPGPPPEILVGDVLNAPFEHAVFDSVSVSFGLRNVTSRLDFYAEAWRVLKPGGRLLVLEMFHDRASRLAPLKGYYLKKIVPVLGGRLVSREHEAYQYLVSSIMSFPQPAELLAELNGAGFVKTGFRTYTFNSVMLAWGEKSG